VTVRLITYTDDYYGMSRRDIELAAPGLASEPRRTSSAFTRLLQLVIAIAPNSSSAVASSVRVASGFPAPAWSSASAR
jgi:hypothetical protein